MNVLHARAGFRLGLSGVGKLVKAPHIHSAKNPYFDYWNRKGKETKKMIDIIIGTLWFAGIVVMGYGVFAAPSGDIENWYQKDQPYQKIRMAGASLLFLALVVAVMNRYL